MSENKNKNIYITFNGSFVDNDENNETDEWSSFNNDLIYSTVCGLF